MTDVPDWATRLAKSVSGTSYLRIVKRQAKPDESIVDALSAALDADEPLRKLVAWLPESLKLIRFFHGAPGWEEYQQSPEMRRLQGLLRAFTGEGASE